MGRKYIGGLMGATPLAGDPVDLRTSGVFNIGSLGGDIADGADGGDADFDSVVLLLDGEGSSITDKSNASPTTTVNGNTQVTTAVKKFGAGSIDFDGTGDYLEVDFENNIGASGEAFTVECWVYFDTYNDDGVINLTQGGFGQGANSLAIGYFSGQWRFYDDNTSSATGVTPGPSTGQWYHVAIVFNGTNLVFYVDGVARLTRSNHASNMPSGGYPTVIFGGYYSSSYLMDGKVDDIRVTKGVARYSSSFTPPTSALSADVSDITGSDDVVLLLDGDDTPIADKSSSPHTITVNGDTQVDTAVKKFGTGSIEFDGTGDYLSLSSSSTLPIPSDGGYTVECWVKFAETTPNTRTILTYGDAVTGKSFGFRSTADGNLIHYWWGSDLYTTGLSSIITWTDWNHVAATWDGTYRKIFVNGVERASDTPGTWLLTNRSNGTVGARVQVSLGEYMYGYIDDLRVTKGVALYPFRPPIAALPTTGTVAGATKPTRKWGGLVGRSIIETTETVLDADFDSVVLLLDGEGAAITDKSSTTTVTATGAAITTSEKKFGTGSISFNGTNQYLTLTGTSGVTAFGNDDFTLETWIYATSASNDSILENRPNGSSGDTGFVLVALDSTTINYYSGGGTRISASVGSWLNGWHHVAVTRNSGTTTLWFDGVSVGTTTHSTNMTSTADALIGDGRYAGAEFAGYLDDFRITKGIARYTANFTPPTSALSADVSDITGSDDVVLLLDGDNNITDRSSSGHTMSWPASAAYQSSGKFNQALGLTSTFLNGPTTTQTSDFQFGTDDFTLESWIYWPSGITTADKCLFDSRTSAGDAGLVWFFQGNTSGTLVQRVYNSNVLQTASSAGSFSLNAWHHVALVRSGNTFTYFTDGQNVGSFTFTGSVNQSGANPLRIGARQDTNFGIQGYVDDFRVTKGAALYPFHPPIAALPTTGTVSTTNVPTTGVLSLAEHYQSKL